jgi:hypothetical protein
MYEHLSSLERVTSEPHLGLPVWFELDRPRVQSEFSRKTGVSVSQTGWSGFGRFSLRKRRALVTEIGPTSTQVAFGQGMARVRANLGASGGRD